MIGSIGQSIDSTFAIAPPFLAFGSVVCIPIGFFWHFVSKRYQKNGMAYWLLAGCLTGFMFGMILICLTSMILMTSFPTLFRSYYAMFIIAGGIAGIVYWSSGKLCKFNT